MNALLTPKISIFLLKLTKALITGKNKTPFLKQARNSLLTDWVNFCKTTLQQVSVSTKPVHQTT
jgi:hypothetical protein